MDQKLFLLINSVWTHPLLDRFMAILSSFDAWLPVLIVVALVAAWRGGFRTRAFLCTAAVAVGIADGAIANPLKKWTDRPRPGDVIAGVRKVDLASASPRFLAVAQPAKVRLSKAPKERVPGRSFPSSHTSNTMALAVVAWLFYPRRGWVGVPLALGVAYSRIYTGSHWPSDVAGSIFLGVALGLIVAMVAQWGWSRWGSRWLPKMYVAFPTLLA